MKLKYGSIKFKNYFKQLAVPFKIYADFEFLLKGVKSSDKNNKGFAYKSVCINNKFSKKIYSLQRKKIQFINSLKQF